MRWTFYGSCPPCFFYDFVEKSYKNCPLIMKWVLETWKSPPDGGLYKWEAVSSLWLRFNPHRDRASSADDFACFLVTEPHAENQPVARLMSSHKHVSFGKNPTGAWLLDESSDTQKLSTLRAEIIHQASASLPEHLDSWHISFPADHCPVSGNNF